MHIRYVIGVSRHGTVTRCLRACTVSGRLVLAHTIAQQAVDAVAMVAKAVGANYVATQCPDIGAGCLVALCERLSTTVSHSRVKAQIRTEQVSKGM